MSVGKDKVIKLLLARLYIYIYIYIASYRNALLKFCQTVTIFFLARTCGLLSIPYN